MSSVWLIRHGKSGYAPGVSDFDRPLNDRGKRDAKAMHAWIAAQAAPDRAFVSPAARTMATAETLFPEATIEPVPELYLASSRTILATVEAAALKFDEVVVIGHNPGIGQAIGELSRGILRTTYPTLSVARFDVTTDPPWSYRLDTFVTPKMLREN